MKPKRITLHCSASPNGRSHNAADIDKWHKERGFNKIGYHFVIPTDGRTEKGRELTEQGAHVEGENTDNVGVCLIGTDKFSFAQLAALLNLLKVLRTKYSLESEQIFCHYEFDSAKAQGKTCPNIKKEDLVTLIELFDKYTL